MSGGIMASQQYLIWAMAFLFLKWELWTTTWMPHGSAEYSPWRMGKQRSGMLAYGCADVGVQPFIGFAQGLVSWVALMGLATPV